MASSPRKGTTGCLANVVQIENIGKTVFLLIFGHELMNYGSKHLLHIRVITILEILEILKGPSRFRIFKKKIFGKLPAVLKYP